uniref:Uncharacterized protein n=1 Tax=Heterorhabditis bacteriophora TaxID=37862 RepID=A0A1I7XKC9_HETBA
MPEKEQFWHFRMSIVTNFLEAAHEYGIGNSGRRPSKTGEKENYEDDINYTTSLDDGRDVY